MFQHTGECFGMLFLIVLSAGAVLAQQAVSPPAAVQQAPLSIERLDDEASRAIARVYDYEASIPLEARVVEKVKKDDVMREKVVFRGVQGFLVCKIRCATLCCLLFGALVVQWSFV